MTSEQSCVYIEGESGNTHTQNPKDHEDKTVNRYLLLVEARTQRRRQLLHMVQALNGEQGNPAAKGNPHNSP